jgi:hypothetical protein
VNKIKICYVLYGTGTLLYCAVLDPTAPDSIIMFNKNRLFKTKILSNFCINFQFIITKILIIY